MPNPKPRGDVSDTDAAIDRALEATQRESRARFLLAEAEGAAQVTRSRWWQAIDRRQRDPNNPKLALEALRIGELDRKAQRILGQIRRATPRRSSGNRRTQSR